MPASKVFINKIELSCTPSFAWGEKIQDPLKKSTAKSSKDSNQSLKSLNVDGGVKVKSMTLNLNLSRKVLSIEFDIDRSADDHGMMEEESLIHGNLSSVFNDG